MLADTVVCLLINNPENLEGAQEVLRSIRRSPRLPGQKPVRLLTALTRIPITQRSDVERTILRLAQDSLAEELPTCPTHSRYPRFSYYILSQILNSRKP